jgi:hypothetical protein
LAGAEGGAPSSDAGASFDGSPFGTSGCTASQPGSLLCNTLAPFPPTIAETGLFPAAPDLGRPAPVLRLYRPDPELWSDGMAKERYLVLPQGKQIDNSNSSAWEFPNGTLFVKTFFDENAGSRRAVETRLLRRRTGSFFEYEFAVYRWSPDGQTAELLDNAGQKRVPVMITLSAVNGGRPFVHEIPSANDCGQCHDSNLGAASTDIIGFDELRLNSKLPGAARTQLEDLAAAKIFTMPVPATPKTITEPDPRLRRLKSFVHGNCVHCHNGGDPKVAAFDVDSLVEIMVGKEVEGSGTTPPPGWLRVIPGNPENSVLFVQVNRNVPMGLNPMPPIGVANPDPQAVSDLKTWICGLPGAPRPPLPACRP